MQAQVQDRKSAAAEVAGDSETAKACRKKSVALKDEAKAYWVRGITARPTATDILSNLGYAYSEANDLQHAEYYLKRAIEWRPNQSRPHNNLGRILLRRSQQREAAAHETEAKAQTDPDARDKTASLHGEAQELLNRAIEQFEKAVEIEPSLLEARLNLGEVHTQLKNFDKAEARYRAVLKFQSQKSKSWDDNANFSQAHYGLARVAIARKRPDEAIEDLHKAIELNPANLNALQTLAAQWYERGSTPRAKNACKRGWPSCRRRRGIRRRSNWSSNWTTRANTRPPPRRGRPQSCRRRARRSRECLRRNTLASL